MVYTHCTNSNNYCAQRRNAYPFLYIALPSETSVFVKYNNRKSSKFIPTSSSKENLVKTFFLQQRTVFVTLRNTLNSCRTTVLNRAPLSRTNLNHLWEFHISAFERDHLVHSCHLHMVIKLTSESRFAREIILQCELYESRNK